MSSFQFQGGLYRTRREMLASIADAWLTADGLNDARAQHEYLAQYSDLEAAAECVEGWGLDKAGDAPYHEDEEQDPSHMAKHGYEVADLANAFVDARAGLAED